MNVNLRQRLKNITNRDWSSKSIKQNTEYLKKQLKDFGLNIPKYLKQGKLTTKNIIALVNKLQKQAERTIEQKRNYGFTFNKGDEKAIKSLLKEIKVAEKNYINSYKGELDYYAISENKTAYFGGETPIHPPVMVQKFKSINHLFKVQEPKDIPELMDYLENYKYLLEENVKDKAKSQAIENINDYSNMLLDLGEIERLSTAERLTDEEAIQKKVMDLSVTQLRYVEQLLQNDGVQLMIESLVASGYSYHEAFDIVIFGQHHVESLVVV